MDDARPNYQALVDAAYTAILAVKRHHGDDAYYRALHANAERLFDAFAPFVPGLRMPGFLADGTPKH